MRAQYDAFVSYSRHDIRVAKWLQDYVESRPIPSAVARKAGFAHGQHLRVFRDQTDLSGHPGLTDALREALDQSRFLIVICSPYAVASKHVAAEIDYFQSLGRTNNILCVIAGGDPNDSGLMQCFPDVLRSKANTNGDMPLAADLRTASSQSASEESDKVVAPLLGVTLRELRAKESIAARRRSVARIAAASVIIVAGFAVWDGYFRTHTEYFRVISTRGGQFAGVGQLSLSEARARAVMYAISKTGRYSVPSRIELKRGLGRLAPKPLRSVLRSFLERECHSQGAYTLLLDYGNSGVEQITWLNPNGLEYEKLLFAAGTSLGDFREGEFGCTRSSSGIKYVRYENKGDGHTERIMFLNSAREPAMNDQEAFGYELRTDTNGLEVSAKSLGAKGEYWADANGVYEIQYDRSASGDITRSQFLDLKGNLVRGPDWCAAFTYELDEHGNSKRVTCIDPNGKSTPDRHWVTTTEFVYDDDGRVIRATYLNADGKPMRSDDWVAEVWVTYEGTEVRESYRDPDGRPTLHKEGQYTLVSQFDRLGNQISHAHFGADSRPTIDLVSKHHQLKITLDPFGRVTSSASFDAAGNPTRDNDLVHMGRFTWDERGRRIAADFSDPGGKPTVATDGDTSWKRSYDERGNVKSVTSFGLDGAPKLDKASGAATTTMEYDDKGNLIGEAFLGIDGKPIRTTGGVASARYEYGIRRGVTKSMAFGTDLKPTIASGVGATVETEHGPHGVIRTRRFDADGRLAKVSQHGYAGENTTYDDRGLVIKLELLNEAGAIAVTEVREFDDRGLMTKVTSNDPNNRYAGWTRTYDDRGLEITLMYLNEKGQRATVDKVAGWRTQYDERGRIGRQSFFDADLQPTPDSLGVTIRTYEYDDRGNETWRRYLGPNGSIADINGIASYVDEYDDRDRVRVRRYYGQNDLPVVAAFGYAGRRQRYDDQDREIERVYFGLDGAPVLRTDSEPKRASERRRYDRNAQLEYEVFYDERGKPVEITPGIYGMQSIYAGSGAKKSETALNREMLKKLGIEVFQP